MCYFDFARVERLDNSSNNTMIKINEKAHYLENESIVGLNNYQVEQRRTYE